MAEHRNEASSTNALLAEILLVLRRMDGRMQRQDERIGILERLLETGKHAGRLQSKFEVNPSESMTADAHSPSGSPTTKQRIHKLHPIAEQELPRRPSNGLKKHKGGSNELVPDPDQGEEIIAHREELPHAQRKQSLGPKSSLSRSETWDSLPSPLMQSNQDGAPQVEKIDDPTSYARYPPPRGWICTKSLGRRLDIQYGLPEAMPLWTRYVGDSWTIPPDGRVEMSFQQHLLERLNKDQALRLLKILAGVSNKLEYQNPDENVKRGSFRVSDFDFDPNYEESAADYRAEFSTGIYKARPLPVPKTNRSGPSYTAPWKRIIEIRGLSKMLMDEQSAMTSAEHEVWSTGLRDPWVEALPKLNSVCPFLTHREGSSHSEFDASSTIDRALSYHQRCLPYTPPKEDKLFFHVSFFELINLAHETEHEGEMWKLGKLHSDDEQIKSRRLRESACTIVVVCDPIKPTYWTSIYLCPFNFDLYEKVSSIISTQDAPSVAADMIEFTMRMVIKRWQKISEYFAWLIEHRDALADPEIHDSLLFDDDSFSRSRRYFWVINYLAELDVSIGGNVMQVERWIADWPQHLNVRSKEMHAEVKSLPERLDQLKTLQEKLRALRQEAFALRDGLFSASGVIESRAATRLGENVKLLTFVSIFFLPLSFCMSVWNINDAVFSFTALTIVAILLPLGTYLLVFNLNNLVTICSGVYNKQKRRLILQMEEDDDAEWSELGKRFHTFRPRPEKVEPSDWMMGIFLLHKCIKAVGLDKIIKKKTLQQKDIRERKLGQQHLDLSIFNDTGGATGVGNSLGREASTSKRAGHFHQDQRPVFNSVLAFHWENDDIGVVPMETELLSLFQKFYGFNVESFTIPTNFNAPLSLSTNGQINNSTGRITGPKVNWFGICGVVEGARGDILYIFDTCFAASAAIYDGPEVLAAVSWGDIAGANLQTSFTTMLIDELKVLNGTPCSVAHVYASIHRNATTNNLETGPVQIPKRGKDSVVLAKMHGPKQRKPESYAARKHRIDGLDPAEHRVLIAVNLQDNICVPDMEEWKNWLTTNIPSRILSSDISIEAIFRGSSSLLLVTLPVEVWTMLPADEETYNFVSFV